MSLASLFAPVQFTDLGVEGVAYDVRCVGVESVHALHQLTEAVLVRSTTTAMGFCMARDGRSSRQSVMKGDKLAEAVKALALQQPILMLTAFGESLRLEANFPLAVDLVMGKPFMAGGVGAKLAVGFEEQRSTSA